MTMVTLRKCYSSIYAQATTSDLPIFSPKSDLVMVWRHFGHDHNLHIQSIQGANCSSKFPSVLAVSIPFSRSLLSPVLVAACGETGVIWGLHHDLLVVSLGWLCYALTPPC